MALISCLVVMVCVIYSSTVLSLKIFNFPLVFQISFLFAEIFQVLIIQLIYKS